MCGRGGGWTLLDRNRIARTQEGFLPRVQGGRDGSTMHGDAVGVWPGGKESVLGWWIDFSPLKSPMLFAKPPRMTLTAPLLWPHPDHIVLQCALLCPCFPGDWKILRVGEVAHLAVWNTLVLNRCKDITEAQERKGREVSLW